MKNNDKREPVWREARVRFSKIFFARQTRSHNLTDHNLLKSMTHKFFFRFKEHNFRNLCVCQSIYLCVSPSLLSQFQIFAKSNFVKKVEPDFVDRHPSKFCKNLVQQCRAKPDDDDDGEQELERERERSPGFGDQARERKDREERGPTRFFLAKWYPSATFCRFLPPSERQLSPRKKSWRRLDSAKARLLHRSIRRENNLIGRTIPGGSQSKRAENLSTSVFFFFCCYCLRCLQISFGTKIFSVLHYVKPFWT